MSALLDIAAMDGLKVFLNVKFIYLSFNNWFNSTIKPDPYIFLIFFSQVS